MNTQNDISFTAIEDDKELSVFRLLRRTMDASRECSPDIKQFTCVRCGKKKAWEEGAATCSISGMQMTWRKAEKTDNITICVHCLQECLQLIGFPQNEIDRFVSQLKPYYVKVGTPIISNGNNSSSSLAAGAMENPETESLKGSATRTGESVPRVGEVESW